MSASSRPEESVWDYPRPPRAESSDRHLKIVFAGEVIADTTRSMRVLETSHPPTFYIPREDVRSDVLEPSSRKSMCEWKGVARYFHIVLGDQRAENAAWCYPNPTQAFSALVNYLCFYPSLMEACYVDGEQVQPQEGDFYGGWITSEIKGPFKGAPGTMGW